MKPVDFVKALGVAILAMVLDILCAIAVVSVWTLLNRPDHPLAATDRIVVDLSTQSTRICGPIILALLVWLFSRRRPDRHAYAFATAVFGFYLIVDWGMVAFQGMLEPVALGIAALKLAGALAGAWLAERKRA